MSSVASSTVHNDLLHRLLRHGAPVLSAADRTDGFLCGPMLAARCHMTSAVRA
ncbi:hypothetical protein WIS52_12750 [Pseudonocardia nematodicida]|uniref:Uncharacterized protein n=1 Tax=Pseudonocardia nematodicida TaxID=1206997 RepID=A0ABV1KA29_9PSEU